MPLPNNDIHHREYHDYAFHLEYIMGGTFYNGVQILTDGTGYKTLDTKVASIEQAHEVIDTAHEDLKNSIVSKTFPVR